MLSVISNSYELLVPFAFLFSFTDIRIAVATISPAVLLCYVPTFAFQVIAVFT